MYLLFHCPLNQPTYKKSTLRELEVVWVPGGPESGDFLDGGFWSCAFNETTETDSEDGVTTRGSIIH